MDKTKVLFVCLGNICRSPTGEGVFKHIVQNRGLEAKYEVDSAGTNGYHDGEQADARMRSHAVERGYDLASISRQVKTSDFNEFDYIIAMDDSNVRNLKEFEPTGTLHHKIRKMTDFGRKMDFDEVPDPYYGGPQGFELVIDLVEDCSEGLLDYLENSTKES